MDRLWQARLVSDVVEALRENESWTAESHVQKCIYMVKELFGTEVPFRFVPYKHGPYSFELRDEIGRLLSTRVLVSEPARPYGPRIRTRSDSVHLRRQLERVNHGLSDQIVFVAGKIGKMSASDVGLLATGILVLKEQDSRQVSSREPLVRFRSLKPAVEEETCIEYISKARNLLQEARKLDFARKTSPHPYSSVHA